MVTKNAVFMRAVAFRKRLLDHKKERGLLEYQYNADAFEDVGEILRPFL